MRTVFRILVLVIVLPSAFTQFIAAQAHSRQLQVVIVAVHSFADQQYDNPLLEAGIRDSENGLVSFFAQHFPNVRPRIIDLPQDTTSSALTTFFKSEFPSLADGNVTLLFVLSHGEADPPRTPPFGGDLFIATQDTVQAQFKDKALSLTNDIVGRLQGRLPGTIVYAFMDTCHGGAASSAQLRLTASLDEAFGTNLMFMSSSLSDQLAFKASFSAALIKLWDQQSAEGCTSPEQSVQTIRQLIFDSAASQGVNLGPNDGFPSVLIHYHGSFCLESFSSTRGFVVVQNASPSSIVVSFTNLNGKQIHQEPIEGHQVVAFSVPKDSYKLTYYQSNAVVEDVPVDLTGSSNLAYESFGTPEVAALGSGLEQSAAMAKQMGANADVIDALRQRALAAYRIVGDTASALRIEALLPTVAPVIAHPGNGSEFDLAQADELKMQGNLQAAAQMYLNVAKTAGVHSVVRQSAALEAYYAVGATSAKQAALIRKEFSLGSVLGADTVALENRALKSGAIEARQSFTNSVAVRSLTLNLAFTF
jgi:hypothetical protein